MKEEKSVLVNQGHAVLKYSLKTETEGKKEAYDYGYDNDAEDPGCTRQDWINVEAGQLIEAKLDVVMANDITGPMAIPVFKQMAEKVFDKDK